MNLEKNLCIKINKIKLTGKTEKEIKRKEINEN